MLRKAYGLEQREKFRKKKQKKMVHLHLKGPTKAITTCKVFQSLPHD